MVGGGLPAARAQRAAPGDRQPGREGDPQLRSAEKVDRQALAREIDIVDSGPLGGAWTLDRVWERLGIGAAVRRVASDRRLDGEAVERVVFALVAQRALKTWALSSFTPPLPTSSSTCQTSLPTSKRPSMTMASAVRSSAANGASGTPRTSAPTYPRCLRPAHDGHRTTEVGRHPRPTTPRHLGRHCPLAGHHPASRPAFTPP